MCLFQGTYCGSIQDTPIFFVPPPAWGFALIRHPSHHSVPRSLETFAGIGGWGQVIRALLGQDHPIFSVEIDFEVAQALAITTDRRLLSVEQFLQDPHVENAVVVADIMDNRWWFTTLIAPFTGLGWSPPCHPWSKAGKRLGLDHPFGRLLVHSIGVMFLFGIPVGAMENVPGLVSSRTFLLITFAGKAKLFPIPLALTCLAYDPLNFAFLSSVRPDGILECSRVLNDRTYVFCARLRDFPVLFVDGEIVVQVQWPSLYPLAGRPIVQIFANGKKIDEDVAICTADSFGPLRVRIFGLSGGAPGSLSAISEQMQSLLVGHGHPANTVKQQANHIIEKLGQKKCGQILEGKAPWPTLKYEATAAGMTLMPPEGRTSKETKRDLVFDQDPWAKFTPSSSKGAHGASTPKTRKPSTARVDLSFFHFKSQPLAQIDFSQLLQSWSGVHVVRYEDFADLETITTASLCACASAVLVIGAASEGIAKRFPDKAAKVLVPGWVQNQAVALLTCHQFFKYRLQFGVNSCFLIVDLGVKSLDRGLDRNKCSRCRLLRAGNLVSKI
eukprot:s4592_g1.t1